MVSTPGHPNRVTKIAMTPAKPKGTENKVKNNEPFVYIKFRSFESRLVIFPIYWLFAVYCDILDNFVYIMKISSLLIRSFMMEN